MLTRIYAKMFAAALGSIASQTIPTTLEEAINIRNTGKIVVMGGTEPGHSTVTVAALLAEATGAGMLLKISDTNGIYTADPSKNPRAKLIRSITYSDLIRLLNKQQQLRIAGTYDVFDIGAAKILERANIDTVYFNGKDNSKNIFSALNRTIGTKISKYPA